MPDPVQSSWIARFRPAASLHDGFTLTILPFPFRRGLRADERTLEDAIRCLGACALGALRLSCIAIGSPCTSM